MKITELRIGNYVQQFECEPYYFKVEQIVKDTDNSLCAIYRNGSIRDKEPEPIELTEEWLLRFGFEITNRIEFNDLKPCYAKISLALMLRHNSYFVDWIGGNTEIKYVHQLQNLYFALVGKELELKQLIK